MSQRTGMNHYCSVPPLKDPCDSSMKVYSSNIFNHGSLRKPQKWDTFWWTPTHILKLLVCELVILTDLWRFVLQIEVVCELLGKHSLSINRLLQNDPNTSFKWTKPLLIDWDLLTKCAHFAQLFSKVGRKYNRSQWLAFQLTTFLHDLLRN